MNHINKHIEGMSYNITAIAYCLHQPVVGLAAPFSGGEMEGFSDETHLQRVVGSPRNTA